MNALRGNYSEIDELNRILTVERQLVLKTQENYQTLKENFLILSKENEDLKAEMKSVIKGEELKEELLRLEARSDELIKKMRQSNQDREIQYEKFKLDTIEELQNVYRKELKDQNCHIEKLKSDRLDLVKENDELLDTIAGLNSELDTVKRKEKSKEMEIKMQFDQKLKEMVMYTEKVASPRFEHMESVIESLQRKIQKKEDYYLEKSRKFALELSEKNSKIQNSKKLEISLRFQLLESESTIQNLQLQIQKMDSEKDQSGAINVLKLKNDELISENLNFEMKSRQKQLELSKKMSDAEEDFSVRISEFQKIFEENNRKIEDFQTQLKTNETLQEAFDKNESSLRIEQEHRERLELEVKNLYEKLQKSGDDRQQFESNMKMERERLEVSIISLKKKLELTPEAPENVEKLKKELRETMRKQENDKERNQLIISELKLALKRLERNYKDAAIKLQSYTSYF